MRKLLRVEEASLDKDDTLPAKKRGPWSKGGKKQLKSIRSRAEAGSTATALHFLRPRFHGWAEVLFFRLFGSVHYIAATLYTGRATRSCCNIICCLCNVLFVFFTSLYPPRRTAYSPPIRSYPPKLQRCLNMKINLPYRLNGKK